METGAKAKVCSSEGCKNQAVRKGVKRLCSRDGCMTQVIKREGCALRMGQRSIYASKEGCLLE